VVKVLEVTDAIDHVNVEVQEEVVAILKAFEAREEAHGQDAEAHEVGQKEERIYHAVE